MLEDEAVQTWLLPRTWLGAEGEASSGPAPATLCWSPIELPVTGDDRVDHWFRLEHDCPANVVLEFLGLATHTEIWLDGVMVARHATMFRGLLVEVPASGARRIEVCARALTPGPVRPRARWRNRLVPGETLRSVRTSLMGRIPGAGRPLVGPFRDVLLHAPGGPWVRRVRARVEDGVGIVDVFMSRPGSGGSNGIIRCGDVTAPLRPDGEGLSGTLRVADPGLWWPHTHGLPVLHAVQATFGTTAIPLGRVGFRTVERVAGPGFGLVVNGVPIYCRGVVWQGGDEELSWMRQAGLNMIRVPGSTMYPSDALYRHADVQGVLVWQDFMFARFDYPASPEFLDEAAAEAAHVLDRIGGFASLAVLCGGEEVAQAAAMAGRAEAEWHHPLFDEVLAGEAARHCPGIPYVPNAPHGGTPPFAASAAVSHYFGVGAYQRPLGDAEGVRFAAACLAFSNPPDAEGCRAVSATPGDAAWALRVPRDPGAAWTFEDTRDHYAATLLGADMAALRRTDPARWLACGRAGVALAMQSALSTWRADPGCGGALILGGQDGAPGPGWGLVDHGGRAKSALHAVAGVSQPVQVLLRDRGMDGVVVHAFNETGEACGATIRLRGLRVSGEAVDLGAIDVTLPARSAVAYTASAIMGHFEDLTGAWRFGPPAYRVLGAVLEIAQDSQPALPPSVATLFVDAGLPVEAIGLTAVAEGDGVRLAAERFAQFVSIDAGGRAPAHDHFHMWPGETRIVQVRGSGRLEGSVTALNGLHAAHFRGRA